MALQSNARFWRSGKKNVEKNIEKKNRQKIFQNVAK